MLIIDQRFTRSFSPVVNVFFGKQIYKNETVVIVATGWQKAVLTQRLRDNVRLFEGRYGRKKQINKDI